MSQTWNKLKTEQLRKRADVSYADLGRAMSPQLGRQAVGHWFRGRGEPDMKQIKAMAARIGCHWLELVSDDATVATDQESVEVVNLMRDMSPEERAVVLANARAVSGMKSRS